MDIDLPKKLKYNILTLLLTVVRNFKLHNFDI